MAKIKELLADREKLKKYDELKEWKEKLENSTLGGLVGCTIPQELKDVYSFHEHIRDIFIKALDAEIAKLDEE